MAEADVTIAALSQVYSALKNFQLDANITSTKIKSDIIDIYSDCEAKISSAENKLEALRNEETQLVRTIYSLKEKKENEENMLSRAINEKEKAQSDINYYSKSIRYNPDDDYYIAVENARLESIISSLEANIKCLESNIFEYNDNIKSLIQEIQHYEKMLQELKQKIKRAEDKLQRLESAYSRVKQTLDDFSMSITRYALTASMETSRNISAVGLCMRYIEEYMNTNL